MLPCYHVFVVFVFVFVDFEKKRVGENLVWRGDWQGNQLDAHQWPFQTISVVGEAVKGQIGHSLPIPCLLLHLFHPTEVVWLDLEVAPPLVPPFGTG